MRRRDFVAVGGASLVWGALAPGGWAAVGTGDATLVAAMDRIFYDKLALQPQDATGYGLDKGARAALKSRLDDNSAAGRAALLAFNRRAIATVEAIAPAGLSDAGRRYRELALYLYRADTLGPERFGVDEVQQPYAISQQNGAYFSVPDFLDSQHTVETRADADAYLARLAAFAGALDADSERQRTAAARGLIAPGWSLDLALAQMRALRAPAAEQSPLAASLADRAAKASVAGDWRAKAAAIVSSAVYPALDRQIALVTDLRARTPAGDGAWRVAGGDALYAAALAKATTTDRTPEDVHQTGLDQVADLTARLDTVLRAGGLTSGTVGERLAALNARPDQLYPNTDAGRDALLASLNAGIAAMRGKLPQAFADIPNEPLQIRRVPPNIQEGAPNGYYYSAALDGSRPAIYWINLKNTADWPKFSLPTLTYHEGIPGHHLQGGYARTQTEMPLLLRNAFLSAYGEGWALYAEQLADELGGNVGLERAGFMQSLLFRAARLVVDTGIHHYKWSREKATDYMVATTGYARPRCQREVERYCTMIGQACSYKIGHTAWIEARARSQQALGDRFSLPWFHAILKEGVMPLTMLNARVDERVRERLAAG
jgi:uncharacterized protein (DUF885 family)